MTDDGGPRWLDPDQQRAWYLFAFLLLRLPAELDAQMRRDAGITQFDYLVLSALSMSPGRALRLSTLADYTASTLSRLGNVVTRLEQRGLLDRSTDATDGRFTLATLTEAGWDMVTTIAPAHVAQVRRLVFDPLTTVQQRQLGAIAARILSAIDPDRPPSLPV